MAGKDILCDPCLFVETEAESVGFCTICVEYLCSGCINEHRKGKMTRNHRIAVENMPKNADILKAMNELKVCRVHKEMNITYKCIDHDIYVCTVCRVDVHRKCDKVLEIACTDHLARDPNDVQQSLSEIEKMTASLRKKMYQNQSDISKSESEILNKQEAIIQEIIDSLENLKLKCREETNGKVQEALSEIEQDIQTVKDIEESSSRYRDILEASLKYSDNGSPKVIACLLADTVEKAKDKARDIQQKAQIKLDYEEVSVSFNISSPGKTTVAYRQNEDSEIEKENLKVVECAIEKTSDEVPEATAVILSHGKQVDQTSQSMPTTENTIFCDFSVSVTADTDGSICRIVGAVTLPEGQIVIIDRDNRNIKLLSSEFDILHVLRLPERPIRICAIDRNTVAVSFRVLKRINRYVVEDNTIKYCGGFATTLYNHGIAFDGENIFAIMSDRDFYSEINAKDDTIQVEVRNPYSGALIDVIEEFRVVGKKSWSLYLRNTKAIHITADHSLVIAELNRILCFRLEKKAGKTVAIERRFYVCAGEVPKDDIENIASDRDSIYVCTKSGLVLQISTHDFKRNRVLTDLDKYIYAININGTNGRMLLGLENDSMHVVLFTTPMSITH